MVVGEGGEEMIFSNFLPLWLIVLCMLAIGIASFGYMPRAVMDAYDATQREITRTIRTQQTKGQIYGDVTIKQAKPGEDLMVGDLDIHGGITILSSCNIKGKGGIPKDGRSKVVVGELPKRRKA
jgi:hypothetical protein